MKTALLSVYDKAGVGDLAAALHELGWRLVSSGGTAAAIAAAGLPVVDVAELTGFPAILGHRVVTLHPAVHAGLLADLDRPEHRDELAELGIEPIALLVVNLYPFASDPGIELIDVGGPAMIRAAAKNHAHVAVLVDPARVRAGPRRAAGRRQPLGRQPAPPGPGGVRRARPSTTPPSPSGWLDRPTTPAPPSHRR